MARISKWTGEDRKNLLKMVDDGIAEQDIREELSVNGKAMTAVEFAQQLKMAMVEDGRIKQASRGKPGAVQRKYEVTAKGRLTISDFAEVAGFKPGDKFTLESPRGKSSAWRLVPVD